MRESQTLLCKERVNLYLPRHEGNTLLRAIQTAKDLLA